MSPEMLAALVSAVVAAVGVFFLDPVGDNQRNAFLFACWLMLAAIFLALQ